MNQLISSILEWGWGGHGGHLLYGVLVKPGKLGASLERELRVVVRITVLIAIRSKSSQSSPKWDSSEN